MGDRRDVRNKDGRLIGYIEGGTFRELTQLEIDRLPPGVLHAPVNYRPPKDFPDRALNREANRGR